MAHTFIVEVGGCSYEQAELVMCERIDHEEEYGFNYTVNCAPGRAPTLREAIALRRLVEYSQPAEERDFLDCENNDNDQEGHIVHDIRVLRHFIGELGALSGTVFCEDCGEPVWPDPLGSVGVWLHNSDVLGDVAFDLNEDHAARPPEEES